MAQVEPMDIDAIESDFDNKENTFHHNNVLSRTPCTEKGYEELDVSELNMKLRYSITPASSPMSKSLTGPFDGRNCNLADDKDAENGNLTRSLNSTLTKHEGISKSKVLPLQTLSAEPFVDSNRNCTRKLLDSSDNNNITITIGTNDIDENLSLPSTSSSVAHTPEATTPTKEIPKPEGSPILRGLKSVLSMFRPSQSPILPADDKALQQDILSPLESQQLMQHKNEANMQSVLASTPVAANRQKDANSSRRSSPLKESVVFNDDLERELQWKDETTIIFKQEKIPVHKLFFQNPLTPEFSKNSEAQHLNTTVECMDISCNESMVSDKIMVDIEPTIESIRNEEMVRVESDNEFLDCETTFTQNLSCDNEELQIDNKQRTINNVTVDLTKNYQCLSKIESECKNINNSVSTKPGEVHFESSLKESVSMTDVVKTDCNSTNIIEVAQNNVRNEQPGDMDLQSSLKESVSMTDVIKTDCYSTNAIEVAQNNVKNESIDINGNAGHCTLEPEVVNKKLPNETPRASLDDIHSEEFSSLKAVNNEANLQDVTQVNKAIGDFSVTEGKENTDCKVLSCEIPFEGVIGTIENLSDVCTSTLNTIEHSKFGVIDAIEIDKNIEHILNDNEVEVTTKGVCIRPDDLISQTLAKENINTIASLSNNSEQVVADDIVVQGAVSVNVLNDVTYKSFSEDMSVDTLINHKPEDNIPIIAFTDREDDSLPNVNQIIQSNLTTIPSIVKAETEITISSIESNQCKVNRTVEEFDHYNVGHISDTNDGNISLKNSETVDSKKDFIQTTGTFSVTPTMISYDSEMFKLVQNDMVGKSPLDIPLPDEDDIEEVLTETNSNNNNNKCMAIPINQDIIYKPCDENSNKSQATNDVYEYTITSNNVLEEHNETINKINKNDTENVTVFGYDELNLKQCEVSQSNENGPNASKLEMLEHLSHSESDINFTMSALQKSHNSIQIEDYESKDKDIQKLNTIDNIAKNCESVNTERGNESISGEGFNEGIGDIKIANEVISEVETIFAQTDNFGDNSIEKIKANILLVKKTTKGVEEIDEEIITSANNSPYVSVTDMALDPDPNYPIEEIDNPFATESKVAVSPPISPKIVSKGYNFDFDEIDDPFATKTKIRMSPTPDSPNQSAVSFKNDIKGEGRKRLPNKANNKRKSQTERKILTPKKNLNTSLTGQRSIKENMSTIVKTPILNTPKDMYNVDDIPTSPIPQNIPDNLENSATVISQDEEAVLQSMDKKVDDTYESDSLILNVASVSNKQEEIHSSQGEIKTIEPVLVVSNEKSTSSSEQYFSLGTSSGESSLMNRSKNVFNLPEIEDKNFNPFATKSNMGVSPPPSIQNITSPIEDATNLFVLQNKDSIDIIAKDIVLGDNTFNKMSTKNSSSNTSIATNSSNDKDPTVHEILTEDEDTIEGPFLDADDLKYIDKLTDIDVETNMMNFDDVPPQEKDLNTENGELFIDADAYEFLINQNKSNTVLDSGKESLFLKFDPLFAKKLSTDGVLAGLKVQKRQSTPKKSTTCSPKDITNIGKPLAGPSNDKEKYAPVEEYNEDLSTTTKPMMVVNPAVSSIISPRKSTTPPKLNRRSLTFTSPAMAVIDRLLSLSGNSSHLNHDIPIPLVNREQAETDLAITQLRELLAEKEIHVHNLRSESKELKDRLATLEGQVRSLETESTQRLTKINELNERLSEKTKTNKSMATVVEEYERTIASLIAETEQDKKRHAEERLKLVKERDEQTAHLTSMEVSFNDLHSKYEKSKQIILSCKANEDTYKKTMKEFEENFSKMQNNYELLKQHATSKLNHANQELEKMNRAHETEVLKLNAMIKRKDLHITSLEETLTQKTKANEELTAICDELINKVG